MPDDLREHYLRALMLLRDMFEALAVDHLEDAPATVPLRIPVDQLLAWRTRAAAMPLDEASRATTAPPAVDVPHLAAMVETVLDSEHESAMHGGGRSAPEDVARQIAELYAERTTGAPPAQQAEGKAASDHRGVGPDGLPLLRLALPMSVELVAAIARGVCEELEPLGYTVHIGDGSQLVARPAERNT